MAAARWPARSLSTNSQFLRLSKCCDNKKNYLFAGSDSGGITAAALYSLIGTAKLNDIDPQAYLHYVLERNADTPITRVAELLPWNCAAQLPKTAG